MQGKILAEKSKQERKKVSPLTRDLNSFKGKRVRICQKDDKMKEGKILTLDDHLNVVLETEDGIQLIRGNTITYVSIPG